MNKYCHSSYFSWISYLWVIFLRHIWKYFWNIFEIHLKIPMNIFIYKFHLWTHNNLIHKIIISFSKVWLCKEWNAHLRTVPTLLPHLALSGDVKPWRHWMIHNPSSQAPTSAGFAYSSLMWKAEAYKNSL